MRQWQTCMVLRHCTQVVVGDCHSSYILTHHATQWKPPEHGLHKPCPSLVRGTWSDTRLNLSRFDSISDHSEKEVAEMLMILRNECPVPQLHQTDTPSSPVTSSFQPSSFPPFLLPSSLFPFFIHSLSLLPSFLDSSLFSTNNCGGPNICHILLESRKTKLNHQSQKHTN